MAKRKSAKTAKITAPAGFLAIPRSALEGLIPQSASGMRMAESERLPRCEMLWNYLIPQENLEKRFGDAILKGHHRDDIPAGSDVIAFPPESDLKLVIQMRLGFLGTTAEIVSAMPVASGAVNTLKIVSTFERDDGIGEVTAELDGIPLTFFDPLYLKNRFWYVPGRKLEFALYAIATVCRKEKPGTAGCRVGPFFDLYARDYLSAHPGVARSEIPPLEMSSELVPGLTTHAYTNSYAFNGKVRSTVSEDFLGIKTVQLNTDFHPVPGNRDLSVGINLVASERVLDGYNPKKGDEVSGIAFLCASLVIRPQQNDEDDDGADEILSSEPALGKSSEKRG